MIQTSIRLAQFRLLNSVLLILLCFAAVCAQEQQSMPWATDAGSRYWVQPDIVYQVANNQSLKLDVWYQHDVKTLSPTLVYIHGGGWIFGLKEGSVFHEALNIAKVPNQLLTIIGGAHGGFSRADYVKCYETIWEFLRQKKIIQ